MTEHDNKRRELRIV